MLASLDPSSQSESCGTNNFGSASSTQAPYRSLFVVALRARMNSDSGARYPLYILSFSLEAVAVRRGKVYSLVLTSLSSCSLVMVPYTVSVKGVGKRYSDSGNTSLTSCSLVLVPWQLGCSVCTKRWKGVPSKRVISSLAYNFVTKQ